jgi:hypothetical protein
MGPADELVPPGFLLGLDLLLALVRILAAREIVVSQAL